MELKVIIKAIFEALLEKDRLFIFHGPPNTGKSFASRVLAEIFGPYVNVDERQLGKDQLIMDDVIGENARCLWLEEINFDSDYGPIFKRILSGYKQNGRVFKGAHRTKRDYRCPLIIMSTNRQPSDIPWLREDGIKARIVSVEWLSKLTDPVARTIPEFVYVGATYLKALCLERLVSCDCPGITNRELHEVLVSWSNSDLLLRLSEKMHTEWKRSTFGGLPESEEMARKGEA